MAPYKSSAGRNLGKLVKSYLTGNIGSGLGDAPAGPGTLTFTVIKPDTTSETYNISSGSEFNVNTAGPYTITATTTGSPVTVDMLMWGAGGTTVSGDGGAGGFTSGKFTFSTGSRTYYVVVGAGGGLAPAYNGSALPSTLPHSAPIPYGGGGTGILGEGFSGSASYAGPGAGGSAGGGNGYAGPGRTGSTNTAANPVDGTEPRTGGDYGGGGGGGTDDKSGNGGGGAVRIIWGSGRSFPSTNTADV